MEAHAISSAALAPWAEIVPTATPLTVDDLEQLSDDTGWQYELVKGVLVRMPWSGGEASSIALALGSELRAHVKRHHLGRVTGADGGYHPDPLHPRATELAPDVAFVRADRVPSRTSPDYAKAWPIAPDLVVEVASPNQSRRAMGEKAQLYLSFGTRLVWVIFPRRQLIEV